MSWYQELPDVLQHFSCVGDQRLGCWMVLGDLCHDLAGGSCRVYLGGHMADPRQVSRQVFRAHLQQAFQVQLHHLAVTQ